MMLKKEKLDILQSYFSGKPVLKAFLFGSYAKGKANVDSDLDILVELDYARPVGLEFVQMKLDLEKLLSIKVDLVSANGLSEYIKPLIEKEKRLVYDRG